jgi:hypothetical protein
VNDHDAIDAIDAVLKRWFKAEVSEYNALTKITFIIGENKLNHEE